MLKPNRRQLRIGTSGYQYKHWKGVFYPPGLGTGQWFAHYARFFDTVELNNTFYRLPEAQTFRNWHDRTPEGFCYALKYSRFGSHLKHLRDPDEHVTPFLARAEVLGGHLGPILVQLPPKWRLDIARLRDFLAAAPRRYRWTFEFRNPSWLCEPVYRLLREFNAALCIHDMIPDHPREITADWVYLRYHGGRYDGCYSSEQLDVAAEELRRFERLDLDAFVYFNNDLHGHALINAADLVTKLTGRDTGVRQLQWFW